MDVMVAVKKSGVPQICAVCGESSHQVAIHYSRLLCNGCRAFFKRTVQGKMKVTECKLRGECKVNIASRKDCKPCRYQACLRAGVDVNKVQPATESSAESTSRGHREEEEEAPQDRTSRLESAPPVFPDHPTFHSNPHHAAPNLYPRPYFNHLSSAFCPPYAQASTLSSPLTSNVDVPSRLTPTYRFHSDILYQPRFSTPYQQFPPPHPASLGLSVASLPPVYTSDASKFMPGQHLEFPTPPALNIQTYHSVKPFSHYDLTPRSSFIPTNQSQTMLSVCSQEDYSKFQPHANKIQSFLYPSTIVPISVVSNIGHSSSILSHINKNESGDIKSNFRNPLDQEKSVRSSAFMIDSILEPKTSITHASTVPLNTIPSFHEPSPVKQELLDNHVMYGQIQTETLSQELNAWDSTASGTKTYFSDSFQVTFDNSKSFKMSPIHPGYDVSFTHSTSATATSNETSTQTTVNGSTEGSNGFLRETFTSTPYRKQFRSWESPELNVVDCNTPSPINTHDNIDEGFDKTGKVVLSISNNDTTPLIDPLGHTDMRKSSGEVGICGVEEEDKVEEDSTHRSKNVESDDSGMGSHSRLSSMATSCVSLGTEKCSSEEGVCSSEEGVCSSVSCVSLEQKDIGEPKTCDEISSYLGPKDISSQVNHPMDKNIPTPRKRARFLSYENQSQSTYTESPKRAKCLSVSPKKENRHISLSSTSSQRHSPRKMLSLAERECLSEITDSENNMAKTENETGSLPIAIHQPDVEKYSHTPEIGQFEPHSTASPQNNENLTTYFYNTQTNYLQNECSTVIDDRNVLESGKGNNHDNCDATEDNKSKLPSKSEHFKSFLDLVVEKIRNAQTDLEVEKAKKELEGFYGIV